MVWKYASLPRSVSIPMNYILPIWSTCVPQVRHVVEEKSFRNCHNCGCVGHFYSMSYFPRDEILQDNFERVDAKAAMNVEGHSYIFYAEESQVKDEGSTVEDKDISCEYSNEGSLSDGL